MSSPRIRALAFANCSASSRVRYRTTMLVSTASMPPFDLGSYRRIHLLKRLRPAGIGKHASDILGPGRSEERRRFQQHPVRRVLDDETGAGAPPPPLADCLRQDDLTLCRYRRCRSFGARPFLLISVW